jgi:hypothetical protein
MNAKKLSALFGLLLAAVGAVVALTGGEPKPAAPPESPQDEPRAFGWVHDPAAVSECVRELKCGAFRETAAFAAEYAGPDDVFLWDAARKVTGDVLPARDQKSVGSCVGFATASAVEYLMCVQIAVGANEEYRDLAQEVIYGGSRVEIGGGRVRGDGSVGAWAAKWVTDYGVVPRGIFGRHDLRAYDEARCREYGRTGVPDDLERVAKKHPVKSVAAVRSWDECRAAIRNGYPVLVCSDQGFAMQRDADGFCPPQGTWYHAMAVIGVRGGPRSGGFLLNSWGPNAHRGPRGPGDPPPAGFWADAATLDRMLRQGDSWSFSQVVGFPPRELNWYAGEVGSGQWPVARKQKAADSWPRTPWFSFSNYLLPAGYSLLHVIPDSRDSLLLRYRPLTRLAVSAFGRPRSAPSPRSGARAKI